MQLSTAVSHSLKGSKSFTQSSKIRGVLLEKQGLAFISLVIPLANPAQLCKPHSKLILLCTIRVTSCNHQMHMCATSLVIPTPACRTFHVFLNLKSIIKKLSVNYSGFLWPALRCHPMEGKNKQFYSYVGNKLTFACERAPTNLQCKKTQHMLYTEWLQLLSNKQL